MSFGISLLSSFLLFAVFIGSVLSKAKIYPDQPTITYIEGDYVTLSCRSDTPDRIRWSIITSSFKPDEPPQQYTVAIDCRYIDRPEENVPRIKLRKENCDQTSKAGIRWSNLTIEGIRFEDNGTYRCSSGEDDTMTIHVYVKQEGDPAVKVVDVGVGVEKPTENPVAPGRMEEGVLDLTPGESGELPWVKLHCMTGCGYPAPRLTWFGLKSDKSEETIDSRNYTVNETECSRGLYRTESWLTLTAMNKLESAAKQNVTCKSSQDLSQYGVPDLVTVRTAAVRVQYGDPSKPAEKPGKPAASSTGRYKFRLIRLGRWFSIQGAFAGSLQEQPLSTLEITGIAVGTGFILLLVLLGAAIFLWSRSRDRTAEDPDECEKMNQAEKA